MDAMLERGALIARASRMSQVEDAKIVSYLATTPETGEVARLSVFRDVLASTPMSDETVIRHIPLAVADRLSSSGSPILRRERDGQVQAQENEEGTIRAETKNKRISFFCGDEEILTLTPKETSILQNSLPKTFSSARARSV